MKTRKITITALFVAMAAILMYIEFPLPFMPPFLKVDISGVVVLMAVLLLGLKEAFFVLAIKDFIHVLQTQTGGVGELADFIMLSAMILAVYFVVKKLGDKKGVVYGAILATVALVIVGSITNKYMLIPFYSKIMPLEAIVEMCQTVNPNITSINGYIVWGVVPFNAIKGIILGILTVLLSKRVKVPTIK